MEKQIITYKFAKRLRILMAMNDHDNSAVAKLLNCNTARITNLRCAATCPKDSELKRLCEFYEVPMEFLYGDKPFTITQEVNNGSSVSWDCD